MKPETGARERQVATQAVVIGIEALPPVAPLEERGRRVAVDEAQVEFAAQFEAVAGATVDRVHTECERQARGQGIARLSLQSTLNAVAFYKRHGYAQDRQAVVRRGAVELAVVDMSKALDLG